MSSNINEFVLDLNRFEGEIDEAVKERHEAFLLAGVEGLVDMTPVDTGRARANWQVTHGSPAVSSVVGTDKAGSQTKAAGRAVAAKSQPYTVSYVTNNLEYVPALEDGHSQQAPRGMLNVTFNRLQSRP